MWLLSWLDIRKMLPVYGKMTPKNIEQRLGYEGMDVR